MRATVLTVDDHEAFRISARAMRKAGGGCDGKAPHGSKTVEAFAAGILQPVLLDILDRLAVAQAPAAAPDRCAIVPLWSGDDAASGLSLVQMPVGGFVGKGERSGKALSTLVS